VQSSVKAVIDPVVHGRLLADKARVCADAGIQPEFLTQSMTAYCSPVEVDWVKDFKALRQSGVPGLMVVGKPHPEVRCQAICGALIRNFTNARVVPLSVALQRRNRSMMLSPTVLLIPNFSVSAGGSCNVASTIVDAHDLLLARSLQRKSTVICVEDATQFAAVCGPVIREFFQRFWKA
jgi:hypothetical protein